MDAILTTTVEAPRSDAIPNNTTARRTSSRHSSFFNPIRLPSVSPPQHQPEKPFSAQNRRLQLRNAGFRGALVTSRKVSPPFTGWRSRSVSGEPDRPLRKEHCDTGGMQPNPSLLITTSQTRRSSILQEINNTTRRRSSPPRPSVTSLFQDLPSPDPTTDECPIHSLSNPKGQLARPIDLEFVDYSDLPLTSKSRRSSAFWRSPYSTLGRPKRRPNMTSRNADLDLSKYVEYLEAQLAALLDQIGSMDSSATNVQASKFRALNADYKSLKQELLDWETKFEARVKDEICNTIEKEPELRSKIQALEREIEIKDHKNREHEWEIEMATRKLQNMDAVNLTNQYLERRIDVLTELLAQSSVRIESSPELNCALEASSPQVGEHRTPRPRSIFSKIPLSPIRRSHFQHASVPESNPSPDSASQADQPGDRTYILSPKGDGQADDAEMSLDSGLGDSCSSPSTRAQESKRSSMVSHSLSNSSSWGTSFPLSPDVQVRFSGRQRKMRRFPPGSCTLKPLILPAASPYVPAGQVRNHSFSRDPISPFHLRSARDQETSSSSWMEPDTPSTLEVNSNPCQSFDGVISNHRILMGMSPLESDLVDPSTVESSRIFFDDVHSSTQMERPTVGILCQDDSSKRTSYHTPEKSPPESSYSSSTCFRSQTRRKIDRDITPMMALDSRVARLRKMYPKTCTHTPSVDDKRDTFHYIWGSVPSTATLIRGIIANAWHTHWKKLGKLTWWVLGLFLGGQPRNQWLKTRHRSQLNGSNHSEAVGYHDPANSSDFVTRSIPPPVDDTPTKRVIKSHSSDTSSMLATSPKDLRANEDLLPISLELPPKRSFELWAKFSFAIALAIGLALRDGPASLMDECLLRGYCINESTRRPLTDQSPSQTSECIPRMSPPPGPINYLSGEIHIDDE
ncbi:uncharacterized protein PADG_07621 [Paracoccidioides brasiliensis Pb18]|uniref:Uncharacterized protein n=1 Tax=Paracoccidioides brasiliensis (strain Pb18) TaxID=502780 RepID=C1GK35_PARBD|nr:uncharacterized protein PADG_07621 [Paracoccidioides brasiliensis Pb18]EEH42801.1 hypothetical protein PADG_07621 [Paracoccidioides brasiliensis Pb18]